MHIDVQKLNYVRNKVKEITSIKQLKTEPQIIVVTKTFPLAKITPLLDVGHVHFGENKVQECEVKWSPIRNKYKNIKLHMVGNLQSNKAKKAVQLFDYIHSLDNEKLAYKLSLYEKEFGKKVKFFIQVNLADEKQKSGVLLKDLNKFYAYCSKELDLNVIGLMCLPPIDLKSGRYFGILKEVSTSLNLKELSMGMSSDYEDAILNGSTYLRLGTAILGKRIN